MGAGGRRGLNIRNNFLIKINKLVGKNCLQVVELLMSKNIKTEIEYASVMDSTK